MARAPTLEQEEALWRKGLRWVAGVDEAGRGPLAGPVAAAAVVLPPFPSFLWLGQVRDSKALTAAERGRLEGLIKAQSLAWAVALVGSEAIDRLGIAAAAREAMCRALAAMPQRPQAVLVDGPWPLPDLPCTPLVNGDALSLSIACASILAKEARDRLMAQLDALYPGYGFARHKGYPTREHLAALARLGPSPVHRRSFAPLAQGPAPGDRQGLGRWAEELAASYLQSRGYRLLARNLRTGAGELDIVAQRGEVLALVEVRARRGRRLGTAAESIGPRKRQRLLQAAAAYLQGVEGPLQPRLDVLLVELSPRGRLLSLEHIEGAVEG